MSEDYQQLMVENIENAIKASAISYVEKVAQALNMGEDTWFLDLDIQVQTGKVVRNWCPLMIRISESYGTKGKYLMDSKPYDHIDNWLTDLKGRPTDEEAIRIMREEARRLLKLFAVKGLYAKRLYEHEWKIGRKNPVFFKPTKPRGIGRGSKQWGWKVLHNPLKEPSP